MGRMGSILVSRSGILAEQGSGGPFDASPWILNSKKIPLVSNTGKSPFSVMDHNTFIRVPSFDVPSRNILKKSFDSNLLALYNHVC